MKAFCSHFFKEQQVFYIPKKLCCEETFGGDFAGKIRGMDWLIIPSRTNIMDLDRESRNSWELFSSLKACNSLFGMKRVV